MLNEAGLDALTGQGTNPGNCQLTMFGARVREDQIEILAPERPDAARDDPPTARG